MAIGGLPVCKCFPTYLELTVSPDAECTCPTGYNENGDDLGCVRKFSFNISVRAVARKGGGRGNF